MLAEGVAPQIEAAGIRPGRPLVAVDADEVLVHFARHLARFVGTRGWKLDLSEYRLDGAIRRLEDDRPAGREEIWSLILDFFETETARQEAIAGAAEGLHTLSRRAQIVVLSNVPMAARAARIANLAGHGIAYPVIANQGGKGRALAELARRAAAPVAFIDDSPAQIESAARHAGTALRVHFVGSEFLRPIAPQVPQAHCAPADWPQVVAAVEDYLAGSPGPRPFSI
ncbi:MAG: hypothetical protein D6754_06890 [Alphaproteobacteria bacterium]|nr:MAG: hypothetical protein D6754_06890 [Alphaproteobacteria bacterium]